MKNWIDIGLDADWPEHGGRWARRAKDGSYFVIVFDNMREHLSEAEMADTDQYYCSLRRVDLKALTEEQIRDVLKGNGMRFLDGAIISDTGDEVATENDTARKELVIVEACVSYGLYEPLDESSSNTYPERLRAHMRRIAEAMMADSDALEAARQRPVNKIGSTAAEYGRGDIESALLRGTSPEHALMRKLHGIPEKSQ